MTPKEIKELFRDHQRANPDQTKEAMMKRLRFQLEAKGITWTQEIEDTLRLFMRAH